MDNLIDYAKVNPFSTENLFAAHLHNAQRTVQSDLAIMEQAKRRFGKTDVDTRLAVLKEAVDTLTLANRHGLTENNPLGTHNGKQYGVLRGRLVFVEHFNSKKYGRG